MQWLIKELAIYKAYVLGQQFRDGTDAQSMLMEIQIIKWALIQNTIAVIIAEITGTNNPTQSTTALLMYISSKGCSLVNSQQKLAYFAIILAIVSSYNHLYFCKCPSKTNRQSRKLVQG